jgi:hypothetical protein
MTDTLSDLLRQVDPSLGDVASRVRPLTDALGVDGITPSDVVETGQNWRQWSGTVDVAALTRLQFDTATGRFTDPGSGAGTGTTAGDRSIGGLLSFPLPRVDWRLAAAWAGSTAAPIYDGRVRLHLVLPSAVLRLPFLRGARPDARGVLVADPAHPQVTFTLPRIGLRVAREQVGGTVEVKLESATVDETPADDVYAFCRMDPPYALIGPGTVAGFAFRTAVLDLSEQTAPPGARGVPDEWQGLWLPEARIYVAPEGMEDIACSGGVRDLYIGLGLHGGVTGTFDVEVLRRGAAPRISLRLHDAEGRWYPVPEGGDGSTVTALAPAQATLVVEADGGLAPRSATIVVGSQPQVTAWTAPVAVQANGSVRVRVQVASAGGGGPAPTTTRTVDISLSPSSPGAGGGGGGGPAPPAAVTTTSAGAARLAVVSRSGDDVTLGIEPAGAAPTWRIDGGAPTTAPTVTVAVAARSERQVSVTRARTSATPLAAYWPFDLPGPGNDRLNESSPPRAPYSAGVAHDRPAVDQAGSQWETGAQLLCDTLAARLARLPTGTALTVTGYASYEPDSTAPPDHNQRLSERRAGALKALIDETRPGLAVTARGVGNSIHRDPAHRSEPASAYWRAQVDQDVPDASDETVTGTVSRGTADVPVQQPPPPSPTTPAPEPRHASWFRRLRVELELQRSRFVRLEITGEVDLVTATERAGHGLHGNAADPMDGVTSFSARVTVDDATGSWTAAVAVRAAEGDRDGLWQVDRSAANAGQVDIAGVFAGLGPLLAVATPPSPSSGDVVPLVLGSAVLAAASLVIHSARVTLRGVEVRLGTVAGRTEVAVLLDVESKLYANLGVVEIPADRPITTRYRALGLGVGHTEGGSPESPRVLFDPSAGYTLDIPAGAVVSRPPLGQILRVLGARVSRDNPTFLEADIGLGVHLGVVTVERARVRVQLDGTEPPTPTLTGLAASVDIPGTFRGRGTLDIRDERLAGAIDVTLVPLQIRASARVTVVSRPDVLGVLIGAEVYLPAPLPLGNSGLAILGFIGGLGVNMRRVEPTGTRTPALAWLAAQPDRDPLADSPGWEAKAGSWAIAAGAVLGTTEGGFLFHLKGLIVLELPGPRLLFMAKANVLTLPPGLRGTAEAQFLAVVDINPAGISAALVAEYDVVELVKVRVPVTAAFDFTNPSHWHLDLGRYDDPVSVEVFSVFRGSGYLMIHGDGITVPGLPALPSTGFAIAVGLRVTFIWGNEPIGLYLRVGAGFDAVLSFAPVGLTGQISIEGELRLFIVSVGANARLDVVSAPRAGDLVPSTWVHGQVCGHVDFWLFSVSGCVDFELGSPFTPAVPPDPLVSDVLLVSRAPAHVEGSATAGPVDGVLARAQEDGSADAPPKPVPLDALPVIVFDTAATPAAGFTAGHQGGPGFTVANVPITRRLPWVRRGDRWWRYEVLSVSLDGALGAGPLPATWWTLPGGPEPAAGAALALLSWVPEPTPRAVISGERLTSTMRRNWGAICDPPAPPTSFLWHWNDVPRGPSDQGWDLAGVPWPDPPGAVRMTPAHSALRVSEPWRCGDLEADLRRGIDVARVVGGAVSCPDQAGDGEGPVAGEVMSLDGPRALDTLAGLLQADVPIRAVAGAHSELRHDFDRGDCRGQVLRSPGDDGREPNRFGDPVAAKAVEATWQAQGYAPPSLVDAVRLGDKQGGFERLDLLLLVPDRARAGGFALRFVDSEGGELGRQDLSRAHVLRGWTDLPERWRDRAGPWHDAAWLGVGGAEAIARGTQKWELVLVSAELPSACPIVEVGWDPERLDKLDLAPGGVPAWYLVLVEAATNAESQRMVWDQTVIDGRRTALSNALTKEDDHALLVAGASYAVTVRWQAYSAHQPADPGAAPGAPAGGPVDQTFRFSASSTPPDSLEPWIVATTPGPEEPAVLCDEVVRLAQATDGVARLFAAYGERLEVVVRAASGRHPQPQGSREAAGPLTPHVLGTSAVAATWPSGDGALRLVSPWEEAVRAVAFTDHDGDCPPPPAPPGHTTEVISYPFDPCTEHLLDVEAVSAHERRLVLRRGFTTSRYRSADELADALAGVRVRHRLADPAPLQALAEAPTGPAIEVAFLAAGLPRPLVPDQPLVTMCWSGDPLPQPIAVVVEAPEPLVHVRPAPVREPLDDPRALAGSIWVARPTTVLEPVVTGTGGVTVARTITAPGRDRVVVLLGPGARGGGLALELRHAPDLLAGTLGGSTPVLTLALTRAPWEDDGLG